MVRFSWLMLCTIMLQVPKIKGQFPIWKLGFSNVQLPVCGAGWLPPQRHPPQRSNNPKWSCSAHGIPPLPQLFRRCSYFPARHEGLTVLYAKSPCFCELEIGNSCFHPHDANKLSKGTLFQVTKQSWLVLIFTFLKPLFSGSAKHTVLRKVLQNMIEHKLRKQ